MARPVKWGPKFNDDRRIVATGIPTFLHIPFLKQDPDELKAYAPDFVILGAPFSFDTMTCANSHMGPRSLRAASEFISSYHRYYDVDYLDEFKVCDVGDVDPTMNPERARENFDRLERTIDMVLDAGALPIVMGGDHSIPLPIQKAVCRRIGGNVGVIHFDSHLDNEDELDGWGHGDASCAARVLEIPNVQPESCCTIGVDSYFNPKRWIELLEKQGFNAYFREDIYERGIEDVVQEAINRASDGTDAVYFTFDIDVMDGPWCPASEMGPNVGGLTFREMLTAIRMVTMQCKIRGFDVNCVGHEPSMNAGPGISANVEVAMIHEYLAACAHRKLKGEDY